MDLFEKYTPSNMIPFHFICHYKNNTNCRKI